MQASFSIKVYVPAQLGRMKAALVLPIVEKPSFEALAGGPKTDGPRTDGPGTDGPGTDGRVSERIA